MASALVVIFSLSVGCGGGGLSGVYKSDSEWSADQLEFSGKKFTLTTTGMRLSGTYKLKDKSVVAKYDAQDGLEEVWPITKDGCLDVTMLGTFCKDK